MDKWQSRKKEETMQQFKPTSTWKKRSLGLKPPSLESEQAEFYLLWALEPTELTREAKQQSKYAFEHNNLSKE